VPIKFTYSEVKEMVESTGETLLSTSYTNNRTKLRLRCNKNNHEYEMTLSDFKFGYRCRYCMQVENTYTELDDCYEVKLTNTKYPCKFYISKDSVDLVNVHNWHKSGNYIVTSPRVLNKNSRSTTLHIQQLLMPNPPTRMTVDHLDRNTMNNKISNLRYATHSEQGLNHKIKKTNNTGRNGVCYVTQKYGDLYRAYVTINNIVKSKGFAINKYGKDMAFNMACEQRLEWEEEYNILSEK